MPPHTLAYGRAFIDALVDLGAALGYAAEREAHVERGRPNPPAVDVAWQDADGRGDPLVIFEVESRASNAAANNVVKVFGQPTERFEKPLFFFHVFLTGGRDTSRLDGLNETYRLHNYRTYQLERGDATRLVLDVLTQHRRLAPRLSIARLAATLEAPGWTNMDLAAVLQHAEALGFEGAEGGLLAEYAALGRTRPAFRSHYLRLLREYERLAPAGVRSVEYPSFIGAEWASPIHIGLLAMTHPGEADWLERLRTWQEESTYMTMIGPHFGLSRDYDEFVLGAAPVLWALTAALMRRVSGAASYIGAQYAGVLSRLERAAPTASFFTAVWMAHVAAACADEGWYEHARKFVNTRGGIGRAALYEPPSAVAVLEEDPGWAAAIAAAPEPVPPLNDFRRRLPAHYGGSVGDVDEALLELCLDLLSRDGAAYEWGPSVARLLHAPARGS